MCLMKIVDGLAQLVATLVKSTKVAVRWARLVLGWVTVSGFNSWCGKFISV